MEVFDEEVDCTVTPSMPTSIDGDISESTTSLPGECHNVSGAPTGKQYTFAYRLNINSYMYMHMYIHKYRHINISIYLST